MRTYNFHFQGCEVGAIGRQDLFFSKTVEAESLREANLKLYDTHDYISFRNGTITISEGDKIAKILKGWGEIRKHI